MARATDYTPRVQLPFERLVRTTLAPILLIVFGVALMPLAGSAQSWELGYDASLGSLPDAQGWTPFLDDPLPDDGLGAGNYLVALGILTQGGTGGINVDLGNRQSYEASIPAVDFDDGIVVIDLRVKILISTLNPGRAAGFGLRIADDIGEFFTLYLGESDYFLRGESFTPAAAVVPFDTTADFADYQILIDYTGASIRVNGGDPQVLDRKDFAWSPSPQNLISFGDLTNLAYGSSQIESVRIARYVAPVGEVRGIEIATEMTLFDSISPKFLTASCPASKSVLSGGARITGPAINLSLTDSIPSGGLPATGWYGAAAEITPESGDWQLRVDVVCGQITGYEQRNLVGTLDTDDFKFETVACPEGKAAIGGGASVSGPTPNQELLRTSGLSGSEEALTEWAGAAWAFESSPSDPAWGVDVSVICSDAEYIQRVSTDSPSDGSFSKAVTAHCPPQMVAIGGGGAILGTSTHGGALRVSQPFGGSPGVPPTGWTAEGESSALLWKVNAWAVCAPIADPTVPKMGMHARLTGDGVEKGAWDSIESTLENGVSYAPGVFDEAFSFDGVSDQWVNVPKNRINGFPLTGYPNHRYDPYPERSFTVDAWIRTSTLVPNDNTSVVNLYDSGGLNPNANSSSWQVFITEEGFGQGAFRDASGLASSTVTGPGSTYLADGQPHHLALVRDSDERRVRLYVDGRLEAENGISTNINDGPLVPGSPGFPDPIAIGAWREGQSLDITREFTGEIDDVKYYDRALTREEIENIAGCGLPVLPRVINLEAALFGAPANDDAKFCLHLEAGDYRATLLTPALDAAARLTGWSSSASSTWSTLYSIEGEIDAGATGGAETFSASAQQAFDDTPNKQTEFTLTADQKVTLSFLDDVPLDNRGGVSIRLEYLPEPSATAMVMAGVACLVLLHRGRRHRVPA